MGEVASALWGVDAQAVAAGILHDTIEDAGVTPKTIEDMCGRSVLEKPSLEVVYDTV